MSARASVLALALLALGCGDDAVIVLSAASTGDVLAGVAHGESGASRPTVVSVAASSVLARQVARGAPADVFVTADPAWIDWLVGEGVAVAERRVVATGALVVVGPSGAAPAPDLAEALRDARRVALADPSHVPAGQYAQEALEEAELWADVAPRVVAVGDVRAALAAVETGVVDRAVVYASDAAASARVRVVAVVPHAPVVFEAALLSPRGRAVFEAITGPGSSARWAGAGFGPADR
ncbi:molybdate ABC transporter substrate-binding protein [Rubrivirga sp.]|uniref:molybdate ABC transporter substrate-binding protein n=1 Tax=Rubrivirga sp. TaxID=1885344 RepID=UPI003B522829